MTNIDLVNASLKPFGISVKKRDYGFIIEVKGSEVDPFLGAIVHANGYEEYRWIKSKEMVVIRPEDQHRHRLERGDYSIRFFVEKRSIQYSLTMHNC